jgi:pilus assembly protein CpaE
VESKHGRQRLLTDLARLSEVCDPGSKVVVFGHHNDVSLYRELTRQGVSEYAVVPVDALQVIRIVADLYAEPGTDPLGRTIAFVGAKGGAGSSMLAHNVSWSLARKFGSDVLLADLDLAFGTAGLDFNQDPTQGIAEAIHSPERLDDTFLDRLLARCSDRLSLLAAPATLDRTYDFDETTFEPIIDVAQGGVPAVVLDVPHLWTGWSKRTLIAADEIVVTAEPDLANLRNAKNLIDLLRQARSNDAPPRLVINKAGVPKRPEIKVDDFASALQTEALAIIPFEPAVFGAAANNGQMIAESDPRNAIIESFDRIAQVVTGRSDARRPRRAGLGAVLTRLRGRKAG